MSSRLLKKALAASSQLSEGYSPWAKYKLKNPSSTHLDEDDSHSRRDDDGEKDHNADVAPKVAPSAEKSGRRASAGTRVQAAPVGEPIPPAAADENNNQDDSTVLDDDDLDVTIPLSDTFPSMATTATTATPRRPPPTEGDDFEAFLLDAALATGDGHEVEEERRDSDDDDAWLYEECMIEKTKRTEDDDDNGGTTKPVAVVSRKRSREEDAVAAQDAVAEERTDRNGDATNGERHKKAKREEGANAEEKQSDRKKKQKRKGKDVKDEEAESENKDDEEEIGELAGKSNRAKRQRKTEGTTSKSKTKIKSRQSKEPPEKAKDKKKKASARPPAKRRGKAIVSDDDGGEGEQKEKANGDLHDKDKDDEAEEDAEAEKKTKRKKGKKTAKTPAPKKVICISSMPLDERAILSDVALNLGNASVVANIPEAMTHVVVGDNKRTMKVFFGLGMGCFIVKPDWLWQSLAAGKWLPEEDFEAVDWFSGARQARLTAVDRKCNLLGKKSVYVSPTGNKVSAADLRHLVDLCGGKVTNKRTRATFLISATPEASRETNSSLQVVREDWLLDSLQHCRLMDPADYTPANAEDAGKHQKKKTTKKSAGGKKGSQKTETKKDEEEANEEGEDTDA